MAETLGSLCDKLTIVKLKQFHSTDALRLHSLTTQENALCEEINTFLADAVAGRTRLDKLIFPSNKVYERKGNEIAAITGDIGLVFSELAKTNCDLWHEQEKVYQFELVAIEKKNGVVKQLALLNLKRNQCIDAIDTAFQGIILRSNTP